MKKPVIIISILFLAIITLSLVRVVISSNFSTGGIDLENIEEKLSLYKTENSILKEKLLTLSSLDYISSRASEIGFVENKRSISLEKSLPLAIRQ